MNNLDAQQQSSVAVIYEELKQKNQRSDLVMMSELDRLAKGGKGEAAKKDTKKGGMNAAITGTENIRKWTEHVIDIDELVSMLNSDVKEGMSKQAAEQRILKEGVNELSEKDVVPWYCVFLHELTGFFSLLLWFGAALCFVGQIMNEDKNDKSYLYLGIVLSLVTFLTGVFSYQQTSKSAAMMAQFKNFIPPEATVVRNGTMQTIKASQIVRGDIVKVKGGDKIPADIVLIETNEMKVNNASLTGESEDLLRLPEEKTQNIFESPNVAFFGTECTDGKGTGICFKTGDNTVIGQIANLAESADSVQTPLSIEIERFIFIISAVAMILGVSFFTFGIFYGYDIINNLVFAIGIIVANVPEGLLATVTVSLALTAQRMATKFVLVKNLESVETLGSTSCICSDKTGTLTQNKMTVSHLFYNNKEVDATTNYEEYQRDLEADPNTKTKVDYDVEDPGFMALMQAVALGTYTIFEYVPKEDEIKRLYALMNKISMSKMTNHKLTDAEEEEMVKKLVAAEKTMLYKNRATKGDASETGLVKFVQPVLDIEECRNSFPTCTYNDHNNKPVEALIPFSSEIKFNAFIRDMNPNERNPRSKQENQCVFMKGAPERILNRCTKVLINGEEVEFTDELRRQNEEANTKFGGMGERVLAFAKLELDPSVYTKSPPYPFEVKKWKEWQKSAPFENIDNINGWFPMFTLTLVGIVSLNDPPRVLVDQSVLKCQAAGIKVIMVTGDQQATAAAIAAKINIISDPSQEYRILKQNGMPDGEAFQAARSIVIHGDELAKKHYEEETLDEKDPEKGRYLLDWIGKKEVVFARTTPSQKLLIVDACQKAGHVVAVTGDGVNDSPAIKKADIGVAMGSGSEVAKNAADMILLDDNFSSIVNGVEEGRLIFDNLKKSIAYTLSSNIPEISPFLAFMVFQFPLPLSTILILCIDLGTDMIPAISFAYENAELDIMSRPPRSAKRDRLVNTKLISFAYCQIGMIQASAGFYTYFLIMNDYGFTPSVLFGLSSREGYFPADTDVYDPSSQNGNNSQWGQQQYKDQIAWNYAYDSQVDLRLFYGDLPSDSWSNCRWDPSDDDLPQFMTKSAIVVNEATDEPNQLCYSSDALIYAQSGYLVSIVVVQWSDLMICKTRNLSISQQGMKNSMGNFGLVFETVLVAVLLYVPFLNKPLTTRPIALPHFAIPSFSFFAMIITYDEMRKLLVRQGMQRDDETKKIKLTGWFAQNTYY